MKNYEKQVVTIIGWDGKAYQVHVGYYIEEIVDMVKDGDYLRFQDMVHKSSFNTLKRVNYGMGYFESEVKDHEFAEAVKNDGKNINAYDGRYFQEESPFTEEDFLFIPLWGYVALCNKKGVAEKIFLTNKRRAVEVVAIFEKINYKEEHHGKTI